MEEALREASLTGALTDLLMGLLLLPAIGFLAWKRTALETQKKWWLRFFVVLTAACFLGFTVHYFCRDPLSSELVWLILYPLLFEVVVCFFLSACAIRSDGNGPAKKTVVTVHVISMAFCLIARGCYWCFQWDDIRLLTVYDLGLALAGFWMILCEGRKKHRIGERLIVLSLALLLPAAFFQIQRNTLVRFIWYFDHNGLTHLLIIFALIVLFVGVCLCLKPTEKDSVEVS